MDPLKYPETRRNRRATFKIRKCTRLSVDKTGMTKSEIVDVETARPDKDLYQARPVGVIRDIKSSEEVQ
jgi:hypothetical protein